MPRARAELQAELESEAARLIAAWLDWTEQTDAPGVRQFNMPAKPLEGAYAQLCFQLSLGLSVWSR